MRVISKWRKVLRRAWSVRLMLLAAALTGIEAVLPFFMPHEPSIGYALLTFFVVCGALVARFVAQDDIQKGEE